MIISISTYGNTFHEMIDVAKADTINSKYYSGSLINIKSTDSKKSSEEFVFDYELFINHKLYKQVSGFSLTEINELLNKTRSNIKDSDFLQVILINKRHHFFDIQKGNESYQSNDGELILDFYSGDTTPYDLEILPRRNLSFFYVENTDGIKNLRRIIDHIEEVAGSGNDFMIYFNAPGEPMVITRERELSTFFNSLFTSITQPPFPSEELKRVMENLERLVPGDTQNVNLDISFYLGQLSYNRLKQRFIIPLIHELPAKFGDLGYTVSIYTDFDVNEKEKGYRYINITKP